MNLAWLSKYNLLIFDEIDSTNSEAIRLAKSGVEGEFIIWSASQTAGRGRNNKYWSSESGNLYVSLLLNRDIPLNKQPQLSFVAAVALYDSIMFFAQQNQIPLKLSLKWPNDLLVEDKKLSGILLESINIFQTSYLVVGVGVNVKATPHNLAGVPVTSLLDEGVYILDNSALLNSFIEFFEKYFANWHRKGFACIRSAWLKRAYKLNQLVTVSDGQNKISGKFKGIDTEGGIIIELSTGEQRILSAGELYF